MSRRGTAGRAIAGIVLTTFLTAPAFSHDGAPVATRHFAIEWEAGTRRHDGRPVVTGVVHNGHGFYAERVALLIEALDDDGRVVGRTYGYLPAGLPPFGHTYFTLPAPAAGARYRVSVAAFQQRIRRAP